MTPAHNYRLPPFGAHESSRCRDCAEKQRVHGGIGYHIKCMAKDNADVRPAFRCDLFHKPGTLF